MTDGEFPFRNFTVRAEGYDRSEVDGLVEQLQGEISELRRALDAATTDSTVSGDARLHDPEGAVTRTLAIAQETADRVLHDAQVEADRRRSEADEQAAATIADADSRAAKMMADIETQTAEVRAQGIAAARSAIQVERDKAVAELGQIRRVRDDIRAEAVELKSTLERYARQATEASEVLGAAATGPLLASELPDFVADDIALAGVLDTDETSTDESATSVDGSAGYQDNPEPLGSSTGDSGWLDADPAPVTDSASISDAAPLAVVDDGPSNTLVWGDDEDDADSAMDLDDAEDQVLPADDTDDDAPLADVIAIDGDAGNDHEELPSDLDTSTSASSGAFLAEVRAAADDTVLLPPENEGSDDSDRFLSELRGVTESVDIDSVDLDDEAADRFFDSD